MKTQKRHDIIIVQLMSKLNVGRKKCPCIEVHKLDGVNDMNGKNKNNNPSEMIIYTTEDGLAKIETTFDGDTVWLSIDQMAELFQRDRSVIGKHVRNIFKEGELQKESVWAKFAHTAADGKVYDVDYYKDTKIHLLSGIVKCPVCGVGMYGNKSIKHKADGAKYKDFFYYGCKHRTMTHGHKCDFKKQINEEVLDSAVAEVIVKLVSNPKFAAMMQEKISMKVDTSAIEQEIAAHEKQLRQSYSVKARLMDEIDSLDPDDKHYIKRKADLDDRLYKMYDKIEDTENQLVAARAKKMAIEAEKLTGDNIYKVLIFFDKLYSVMDDQEKRQLMESLLSEIQIYEERQPNGQWLKSIKFKLPIIAEDMSLSLDNDTYIETVALLSRETNPLTVEVSSE